MSEPRTNRRGTPNELHFQRRSASRLPTTKSTCGRKARVTPSSKQKSQDPRVPFGSHARVGSGRMTSGLGGISGEGLRSTFASFRECSFHSLFVNTSRRRAQQCGPAPDGASSPAPNDYHSSHHGPQPLRSTTPEDGTHSLLISPLITTPQTIILATPPLSLKPLATRFGLAHLGWTAAISHRVPALPKKASSGYAGCSLARAGRCRVCRTPLNRRVFVAPTTHSTWIRAWERAPADKPSV